MTDLAPLEDILGHRFARPELLIEALTHGSVENRTRRDYQRLEFLGDRVLGLIVASDLLKRHPTADVGGLSRRLNELVREETLAAIAAAIGLGRYLRLSKSEDEQGGRNKSAILADVCEAVICALYLDGGMPAAENFVRARWAALAATLAAAPKDAKSALQEYAQARGKKPPSYAVVEESGPAHNPRFVLEARVAGFPPARGEGGAKRLAEQAAAQALLDMIEAREAARRRQQQQQEQQ